MPFAMIHLNIAKNIIESAEEIKEPHQFMLGAIAPDAVHYIDGYHSGMKSKSHFCVGDERWGCVTNEEEWIKNVIQNIERYKNHKDRDFYLGYFTHVLTDIQNNIKVWRPFKESIKGSKDVSIGKRYHVEAEKIDVFLHQRENDAIQNYLNQAAGIDIDEIKKEQIDAMKNEFLEERCVEAKYVDVDVSVNEYVKINEVDDFICEVSEYINNILFGVKNL